MAALRTQLSRTFPALPRILQRIGASRTMRGTTSFQILGQTSCFVAGTPLLTPTGARTIEQFRVGDPILSRAEGDAEGPVEIKIVEKIFVRVSPIIELQARGQNIRTTAEHPFFVRGKGWICAREIKLGDQLLSHDGQWVTVEAVSDLKEVATVYNLRVSDHHTYFVGSPTEWGFSIWAHNANYEVVHHGGGWYRIRNTTTGEFVNGSIDSAGRFVPGGNSPLAVRGANGTQPTLAALAGEWNVGASSLPGLGEFAAEIRGAGWFEFTAGWSTRGLPGAANEIVVYVVRNKQTGQLLKVGDTTVSGATGRFSQYRGLARARGVEIEIQYTRFSPNVPVNGVNTPENLLRNELRAQSHQLPWDRELLQNTGLTPGSFPEAP